MSPADERDAPPGVQRGAESFSVVVPTYARPEALAVTLDALLGMDYPASDFEVIVGVSLGSDCRMRLRPYPPKKGKNPESLSFNLERRSVYLLRGEARWAWQHHIPATKALRYSITFRTRSEKR